MRRYNLFLLFLFFPLLHTHGQLRMKRVYFLQSGQYTESSGKTICWDTNHNGWNEILFRTGTINPLNPLRWEVWEYRPLNRYELVFADTGAYPYPPGIKTGNFRPYDVGDIDQDGLTDLVGANIEVPQNPDTFYYVVSTQESPKHGYYPDSLSWWQRFSSNFIGEGGASFYFTDDLDNDRRYEILKATSNPEIGEALWENIGNNQNQIVWNCTLRTVDAFNYAFKDFDLDGRKEFVTAELGSQGRVFIRENTGDNQYELVWIDTLRLPNGSDVFSGNDLDSDGKPEFFIGFYVVPTSTFYLYMWEATGNNTYHRTLVDQKIISTWGTGRDSKCGDLDSDGIEEIIWSVATWFFVYKATGNNQFQQVWQWHQDHGNDETIIVNIFDMNKNGYNEIVVGGSGKTSIFEVEAVKVLRPNGGENFSGNSQEVIKWQTFYPPRCDSLSLFFSSNNGRSYEVIATGIPGTDTSYLWQVPNINSDSCLIRIIAYGPGWQYDESDGVFSITPTGIEETLSQNQPFKFAIFPNPAKGIIRFKGENLPGELYLNIYNLSGRLLRSFSLIDENRELSITLPNGVYFLELKSSDLKVLKKVLLLK